MSSIRCKPQWEAATVPSGNVAGMFTFCSMDYADRKVMEKPSADFYFKNLVLDGGGAAPGAIVFRHCSNVLFDGCVFRNFLPIAPGHPGAISAASVVDNLWCRGCRFESGKFGVYWDGVHNAGFVGCHFGGGLKSGVILTLTNNDMSPLSAAQRTCQYTVVAGCTFQGPGGAALQLTNANTLVVGNTVKGRFRTFVSQTGRGRSNVILPLRYSGAGVKVAENKLEAVDTLVALRGDCARHTRKHLRMETVIRGNAAGHVNTILSWQPRHDPHLPPYAELRDVTIRDNDLAGPFLPQVRLPREALDRVAGIRIIGNRLSGKPRDLLVGLKGRGLESKAVTIENNWPCSRCGPPR